MSAAGARGKRIAIIGGGVAGLTAGYLLARNHRVTLFERQGRLGGNAYSHTSRDGDRVDIAAAAFGKAGYREFYALLSQLGVETALCLSSYLSFHDLDSRRGIYLTPGIGTTLAEKLQILRPQHLVSLLRLFAGLRAAQRAHRAGELGGLTLSQCIDRLWQLRGDTRVILLCALCLLSSMDCQAVLDAPASFFLDKLNTHNDVLSPRATYSVRAVRGGTASYVAALAAPLAGRVVLNADIETVIRGPAGVTLRMGEGEGRDFDAVVFACNADQALALLQRPTEAERRLLGAWRYHPGRVVVHRDHSHFPPRQLMQAYTFLYTQRDGRLETSVNGALWHEPGVSADCPYISTQHPNFPIRDELIDLDTVLRTPIFDSASCASIDLLPTLNGALGSYYCGSHFGYGLHNDAVRSAMAAALALDPSVAPALGAAAGRI